MKLRPAFVFSLAVAASGFTVSAFADPAPGPAPAAAAAPAAASAPAAEGSMDQMTPAPAKPKKAKARKAPVADNARYQHCLAADMADADYFCKSHDAAACQAEKDGVVKECKAEAEGRAPKD